MIIVMMEYDLTTKKYNAKDKYKYKDKDIKRTYSNSDPRDLWLLRYLIRLMRRHDLTNQKTITQTMKNTKSKTNRWTLTGTWLGVWTWVNCLHFRQLWTWIQVYHCDLTIKSDTGQHLQFLRCLTNTDILFETEGNLEGILCPNHHISDVRKERANQPILLFCWGREMY